MWNGCKLSVSSDSYSKVCVLYKISCDGYKNDKESCPAWGQAVEAEKYYKEKLEEDKTFNKIRVDILSYQ